MLWMREKTQQNKAFIVQSHCDLRMFITLKPSTGKLIASLCMFPINVTFSVYKLYGG